MAVRLLAFGLEAIHDCNPVSKVRAFFERYHARGGYTLVNLCNERDYADSDFPSASGVLRFPSDDHHAPPLAQMVAFCEAVHRILTGAPGPAVRSPVETHALLRTKLSSASLPSIDEAETAALDSPADNMGTLDMLHGAQRLAPEALNPDPNAKPSQRAGDAQATGSAAKDDLVPTILHTSKIAPPELMAPTPVSEVSQLPVASEGMGTCKGDAEYDASHSTEDGSPPATDLPVIATHCKAGKGRTGVMMAAYLMWAAHPECASSDDAIAFFRRMRTTDGDAVVNPSQVRHPRAGGPLRPCSAISLPVLEWAPKISAKVTAVPALSSALLRCLHALTPPRRSATCAISPHWCKRPWRNAKPSCAAHRSVC